MSGQPPPGPVYRFEGWELRTDERQLLVRGQPVRLGRPGYQLLLGLIQAGGRAVSKDDLIKAAWPGRVVEENNLTVQVTGLRRALGAHNIVTVPGLGYRLAATPVDAPAEPAAAKAAAPGDLFGRDADIAAVNALLDRNLLITIVGTGGVGKTSLARAALDTTRADWPDGVHWIDLAPLQRGASLPQLVARALAVVPDADGQFSEDLVRMLAQLNAVVVLDNCEHLLADVAAFVRPLLARSAGLRFLATSQEPLHVDGETVYRLAPLAVPLEGADMAIALESGALALFRARVVAVYPAFRLGPEALERAAELCRQLDGLPLAIEMAAARVATLGLDAVCRQIGQRLRLRSGARAAPQRQSTLLETFNWSYGLLSPVDQCVFRRLEPFVGGFTSQMAQELCCGIDEEGGPPLGSWEMLDSLSALVEKSLVQRAPPGSLMIAQDRFHLLESARDFARVQLAAAHESEQVRQRHAEIVADAFELSHYELERWSDTNWAAKYTPERRNLGVALGWACTAHQPALLARLVAALARLDAFSLSDAEVVRYPVPIDVLREAPLPQRARAYLEFGWAYYLDNNRETGTSLLEQALVDFDALGDIAGAYTTLARLIRMVRGRPGQQSRVGAMWARLKQIDEREIPLRTRLGCHITVAARIDGGINIEQLWRLQRVALSAGFDGQAISCELQIADELLMNGRFEEAAKTSRGMLRASASTGGIGLRALTCHNLALALARLGRYEEAYGAAQMLLRAMPGAAHLVMDVFAWVALRVMRIEDSALLAGRSAQLKRERDWSSEPAEAALIAETMARLREELGAAALSELMQIGAAMATPEVLALARPG